MGGRFFGIILYRLSINKILPWVSDIKSIQLDFSGILSKPLPPSHKLLAKTSMLGILFLCPWSRAQLAMICLCPVLHT